jgi:small-conductance mechanosensitive channel
MRAPTHSTITVPSARQIMRRTDFRRAIVYGLLFMVCSSAVPWVGGVHSPHLPARLIALALAVLAAGLGATAVHSFAGEVSRLVAVSGGLSTAGTLRWVITAVGYVLVLVSVLAAIAVPVQQLLVSGAITGVILGIAAQQSLSNVFAGLTLLFSRPFAVGDYITLRNGGLGGQYDGEVAAIGLTFTTLHTAEGPINLPNSAVLAAATGPRERPQEEPDSPGDAGDLVTSSGSAVPLARL